MTLQDASGQVRTNVFDSNSRLINVEYASMSPVTYGYDPRGLVTLTQDQVGTTTSAYDQRGLLTSQQLPGSLSMAYAYDQVGNRTTVVDTSGGVFTSTFDVANRLQATRTPGNKRYTAQYDPASQLTTLQLGNGGTRKLAYDNRGYMTTQVDSGTSGAVSTIVDTYDPGGRKTKQVRDGVTSTYTMDNVGRLTLQNKGGDLSSFAYDNVGHLTLKHNAGESAVTMTRNLLGQVTTYTDGSTLCTNTWDVKGNLTNENIGGVLTTYGWDQENRMTSRARGAGLMNFVYDESHHLRHKEIPGEEGVDNVSFNYLDDVVFTRYEEFFGTRTEQMTPWVGQNLANGSIDFLIDPLGSFVGKTSSTGVGDLVAFFPYGEMEDPTGGRPSSNLWQFVGSYGVFSYSDALKLMWHRWYDANVGSFRSIDPLWPRESAYVYVNGMPHMAVDWEGLQQCAVPPTFTIKGCNPKQAAFLSFVINGILLKLARNCKDSTCKSKMERAFAECGLPESGAGCLCDIAQAKILLEFTCHSEKPGGFGNLASVPQMFTTMNSRPCKIGLNTIIDHDKRIDIPEFDLKKLDLRNFKITYATQIQSFQYAILHEMFHCCGATCRQTRDSSIPSADCLDAQFRTLMVDCVPA